MPCTLHTQAAGEHKPTSEQNIRTLKDRTRSTVHSLPYRKIPMMIIDSILGQAQCIINDFPSKTIISTTMSERDIIEGRPNLDYNTISLNLGA